MSQIMRQIATFRGSESRGTIQDYGSRCLVLAVHNQFRQVRLSDQEVSDTMHENGHSDLAWPRRRFMMSTTIALVASGWGCGRRLDDAAANSRDEAPSDDTVQDAGPGPEFTADGAQLDGRPISVNVPLLRRIHELDCEVAHHFPIRHAKAFGELGLILRASLENGGYWCTPRNTLSFGGNGGDGFHFSFLVQGDRIDSASPIVGSAPDYSADKPLANVILAEDFESFIRLGLTRGYFGMFLFVHDRASAVAAYASPDWLPTKSIHDAAGLDIDEQKSRITAYIAETLKLTPLTYTLDEFQALQKRYMPLLEFKPGFG